MQGMLLPIKVVLQGGGGGTVPVLRSPSTFAVYYACLRRLKLRVKRMANSTAVISLHLGGKRACFPRCQSQSVWRPGGGRLGWRWNSWTIIKTRRVSRSKTPSEVSGISRGGGNAWPFSRHAEVETRSL